MIFIIIIGGPVVCLPAVKLIKETTDQIHAAVTDRKSNPLCLVKHLHTPAHIVNDPCVRIDIAFKAHLFSQ